MFLVESKFQQGWKAGTLCPTVKRVYRIVESQASIDSYYAYLFVLHVNYGCFQLMIVTETNIAINPSVFTEQIAIANLGIMAITRYAHPPIVVPAQLLKHPSKSALPILAVRK
jgi:hypothetical protein